MPPGLRRLLLAPISGATSGGPVVPFTPPIIPPVLPTIHASKAKPFIERVPHVKGKAGDPPPNVQEQRQRRFTEKVSTTINSMIGQGYILQTGINTYQIVGGGRAAARAPNNTDDVSTGVTVGSSWVNTAAGTIYFNVSNAIGAATWKGPY